MRYFQHVSQTILFSNTPATLSTASSANPAYGRQMLGGAFSRFLSPCPPWNPSKIVDKYSLIWHNESHHLRGKVMAKRSEIRKKRRDQRRRKNLMLMLAVIGGALIITAVLIYPNLRPIGDFILPDPIDRPMVDGRAMGDPNAPVVIEEFSDFLCSHCRDFALQTEPSLIEDYVATGKVYMVYRNFPLGSASLPIAESAFCAAEQNKFWEYHDILFANQNPSDPSSYSARRLQAFAEAAGLDVDEFDACTDANRYREEVNQDYQAGLAAGVNSTPTFMINGKIIIGAKPLSVFVQEIETALGNQGGN
jgi:predicted DsbA family dithiol-disulfide isomerase